MFRTSLKRVAGSISQRAIYSNSTRRAFSSARATNFRAFSPFISTGAIASPFIGYLAYQWVSNVAYADDEEVKGEEVLADGNASTTDDEAAFFKNEVIDVKDIETQTTLLDASDVVADVAEAVAATESTEITEEEAVANQGAYNPETGEINWDCPCLGGMANGPCGEEFKAAFSCFVYSEADPKGIDCIEKFQGMQDCFRKYPEVYSEELREEPPVDGVSGEEADAVSDSTTPSVPEVAAVEDTAAAPTSTTTTA